MPDSMNATRPPGTGSRHERRVCLPDARLPTAVEEEAEEAAEQPN
jgi:hypothetical protein